MYMKNKILALPRFSLAGARTYLIAALFFGGCASTPELQEAINHGAKSILLDNFSLDQMREAVKITGGRALLEASGGVTQDQLRAIAATGVDRISIGKLTKDIQAIDYSMRIDRIS